MADGPEIRRPSTSPRFSPSLQQATIRKGEASPMTRNEPTAVPATYDGDFFIWTQQQAAALRLTRDLIGGSVDVEHVAEELEDMGKRDLREVGSFLSRLLEHLLLLDALPSSRDRAHWISEAGHFHSSALAAFTPGMRQLLDLDRIWKRGRKEALLHLRLVEATSCPPDECPFELDALLSEDFDFWAALSRLGDDRPARDTPHP